MSPPPLEAVLIIGASNSGKTTLAKKLARKWGKPIHMLMASELVKNDQIEEDIQNVTWENAMHLSKATLIIEDILSLTKKQDKLLRHIIDVLIHHGQLNLVCCTHHVQGNTFDCRERVKPC